MAQDSRKPSKTKTQDQFKFDPFQTTPKDLPQTSQPEAEKSSPEQNKPSMPRASREKTQQATQNIQPRDQMRDIMSRMKDLEDLEPDTPTYDLVPKSRVSTQDLPAIINKQLLAAGVQIPDWHVVSNLPGNMKRSIMILGKRLFGSLTKTPVQDITLIGNVLGQGPNTSREVNAVAGWLVKNGKDLGSGDIDFSKIMPGYEAKIHQYTLAGARWLLVQDDFGQYIYTWPEEQSLDSYSSQRVITDLKKSQKIYQD